MIHQILRRYRTVALLLTAGLWAPIVFLLCIKNPVQNDIGINGMTLTLEDATSTIAYFSGKPITAFISLRDSALFDDLAWHLGSGKFIYPSIPSGKKIKNIQVKLYWDIAPVKKDSAAGYNYDSIYISKGGELYRSNAAKVFVTNLAPVIDSVRISARTYISRDTLRDTTKAYDTLNTLAIRVFAHDGNQNTLKSSWADAGMRVTPTPGSLNAAYAMPRANYTDTIHCSVYDGQGGSSDRVMFITTKNFRNRPPIIDSIRVKDSVFSAVASVYYYAVSVADSLTLNVFARDSDITDNMTYQWSDKNTKQVTLRPKTTEATMVWACTASTCKNPPKPGALAILDTVTVTVRDNDSAFASKTIIIVKGYLGPNKPPLFDSLRINDTLVKGAWTLVRFQATSKDSIRFRMYGHDPDSADTAYWTVRGLDSTRIGNTTDTSVLYRCKDTVYKDTITFLLSDKHLGSVVKQVCIDVNNRYPLLDSVRCADTVFKSADTVFTKNASVGDSLVLRLFCRDPDAGDSAMVRWSLTGLANDTSRFKNITGYQALYLCKDTIKADTFGVQVFDKKKATIRKRLCINIRNHPPVIDSIKCSDTIFKTLAPLYAKTCKGADSVFVTVFARDLDAADTLKDTLYASSKTAPVRLTPLQYRYICKDSTFTDTLTVIVKDQMPKSVTKKIKLSITKK